MPLITTNNLDSVQVAAGQDNQFQTFNDKVGELDSFLTNVLGVSVSSGNATIADADYRRYRKLRITGNTTAGRSVTLPAAIPREILVDNSTPGNTQSIAIKLGSTTLNLAAGKKAFVETDGTTNGLELIISNDVGGGITGTPFEWAVACSDETTALTTGTAKVTFRMPRAVTLTAVRASLTTAQASGSIFTVNINEAGTTILSTLLTINNTSKTSVGATTPAVISDANLADDAEMTVDITQIGDGTAKGLKIVLIGTRA